ncbi:MAG: YkgJ family cysteine cluster protein, partial [Anaerolineae bacterium]|nr:YkgJ family cysteine cluster protein [Anaerolineae bacterium]
MKIEMDLKRIKKLAAALDDENWEFRTFLKGLDLDSAELDAIVHRINDEVSAQIDCTQCANCCKVVSPVLDEADIARFAAGLNRPVPEFTEIYLILDEDEPGKHMFNRQPCP